MPPQGHTQRLSTRIGLQLMGMLVDPDGCQVVAEAMYYYKIPTYYMRAKLCCQRTRGRVTLCRQFLHFRDAQTWLNDVK